MVARPEPGCARTKISRAAYCLACQGRLSEPSVVGVLGNRALLGLEQRFKNPQPASLLDFLDLVFANSALDQSARHVSRVGMIGPPPAEEPRIRIYSKSNSNCTTLGISG